MYSRCHNGAFRKAAGGRRPPHGFTLVELLVVVTILGVLIALLLPAVQASRNAARRVSCSNNLHQIGIGLHGYYGVHKCFPPGGIEPISPRWGLAGRQLAWSAFLLPYIEQQPLHDRIDFTKSFQSEENAEAAAQIVSTYICPSVPRRSYLIDGRAACDYGGIYGERIDYPGRPDFPPAKTPRPREPCSTTAESVSAKSPTARRRR